MPYMVTFTINIPQMLAYIPYMDPMGISINTFTSESIKCEILRNWHVSVSCTVPVENLIIVARSMYIQFSHRSISGFAAETSCKSSSDEAIVLKLPTAVRALLKQDDDEWPDQNPVVFYGFFWSVDDHLMCFSEQKSIINWWVCRNAPWCPMFGKAANPSRFVRHGVKARTVVY